MSGFNPTDLSFDSKGAMTRLRHWVECESPSYDAGAVNRMATIAARELALLGAQVERIGGTQGFGDCVRARFEGPGGPDGGILLIGHLDTVHPLGTLKELPFREKDGLCYGPGILDMKGGIVIALEAIAALRRPMRFARCSSRAWRLSEGAYCPAISSIEFGGRGWR